MAGEWYLYLIRTRDGALYTGIATDVNRRLAEHEAGSPKGSKYLRSRAPLTLVYRTKIGSRTLALRAEARVKKLPKRRKEEIAARSPGVTELLEMLAIQAA